MAFVRYLCMCLVIGGHPCCIPQVTHAAKPTHYYGPLKPTPTTATGQAHPLFIIYFWWVIVLMPPREEGKKGSHELIDLQQGPTHHHLGMRRVGLTSQMASALPSNTNEGCGSLTLIDQQLARPWKRSRFQFRIWN